MENYTVQTFILLFYIYSFFGWIWETCYVSIKEKHLANRGFLYSPILPIYGFGAIVVLISTLPVQNNLFLVYILGAFGATVLEVITGYLMEVLFKTRYWDYSYQRFSYKGYICLTSTIAWGFFSIIMLKYINVPVEEFVLSLNPTFAEILVILLTIGFTVDVTKSVQNALDLRELLETMATNNERVNALLLELDSISDNFEENKAEFKDHIANIREEVKSREYIVIERIRDNRDNLDIRLRLSNLFDKALDNLNIAEERLISHEENKENSLLNDYRELKARIEINKQSFKNLELRRFRGAIGQLKRNPKAMSKTLKDELEKIKKF